MFLLTMPSTLMAQQRRPIDNQHPLWLIHVDVWYKADPQKIIDLIPEDIRPYVCMNLSLSCQYDTEKNIYKMPQYAFQTYKSWGTVCQHNGVWFTCQPASGGHTHIQDDDLVTFEYFFKQFPNFLGWNFAEQFWGFDEAGDKSSATQTSRWALFAQLVEMSHRYGGFLTVSFCGNIWSHGLNPIGEMKRNKDFLRACKDYPESMLFLYKYTTSSCFYNNESVTFGPFISGLTKNYGVRYDNCGWNESLDIVLGSNHGKKYPGAAGIGTVMEQTCVNGGAVWDGPELTWREECFHQVGNTTVDGYTRRNWQRFANMNGVWMDMFRKILDGTMYIPSREEVVEKTKIVVVNDVNSGNDEERYATWGSLYDGLYKQTDPFNVGNGQWMDNHCYFKSTGRYGTIPMVIGLYDDVAKQIPVQVKKSAYGSRWSTTAKKTADFNSQYPEVSTGDLYVNRYRNQLVAYTPYSYLNKKTSASAVIPLQYNTCDTLELNFSKLSSGVVREYADHLDFYLNNYRNDTTTQRQDIITIKGVMQEPTYTMTKHATATGSASAQYDADGKTYTLTVKHLGGVDVSISCTGTASDRSTDVLSSTPLTAPQQPAAWRGEILIEAEDMDFKNIKACVTDPYGQNGGTYNKVRGQAGNGFMDMGTSTSGSLRHQLSLKAAQTGDYIISVRYTCNTKSGNMAITVNGQKQTVSCKQTAYNSWGWAQVEATLQEGKNNLVITNAGALPMYIDQVSYRPADVAPMKYFINVRETEQGTVIADKSEAAEGDTITLTIEPKAGHQLKQLRVVNSVFYTMEKTIALNDEGKVTFVMPNDNVTLLPVFADMSSVYKLDLNTVDAGTIPPGWRCTQENNEVHEYPNNYGQGARVMSGFSGYQGKGLYWRNSKTEYGRQSAYPLTLEPGDYKLTYAMAAWKESPKYKALVVNAQTGSAVASSAVVTAAPNAGGSTAADVSKAIQRELEFTISEKGKYVIQFNDQTSTGGYHEFLLLECRVNSMVPTGIELMTADGQQTTIIYDAAGRQQQQLKPGLNIVRTPDGRTRKIFKTN
ncbi:MAG: glycosyl hydrolase family 98 [Prevotella sp.]|nr:glycosyl hydrolase family 98 [Prevotella sp.]